MKTTSAHPTRHAETTAARRFAAMPATGPGAEAAAHAETVAASPPEAIAGPYADNTGSPAGTGPRPATAAALEIEVENHPGVMQHVVSLFARRGCNIEAIVCFPAGDGTRSRLWLQLGPDAKLAQMTRFVANLEDVIAVRACAATLEAFARLPELFPAWPATATERADAGARPPLAVGTTPLDDRWR